MPFHIPCLQGGVSLLHDVVTSPPWKTRIIYSQLRTGHSLLLKQYRHPIGKEDDPTCARCGEEEETIQNVLINCPALALRRRTHFETVTIAALVNEPSACLRYLGGILPDLT